MKILHLATQDISGGGGGFSASYRLHKNFLGAGYHSLMAVNKKLSSDKGLNKILNLLRSNNINSEIYSGSSGFKGQLKYADKRNCKYVIICGDDEVSKELVTLKNLVLGSKAAENIKSREDWTKSVDAQKTFPLSNLLKEIKK